jgi:hypothetical protein
MPKISKKNGVVNGAAAAGAPTSSQLAASAAKKAEGRPVKFPEVKTMKLEGKSALTCEQMQRILGWESEEQYQDRMATEKGVTDEKSKKGFKLHERDVVFTHDLTGPVALDNNAGNRFLQLRWSEAIAQSILGRHWAGPTTMPEPKDYVYGGDKPYTMSDGTVLQPGQRFTMPRGSINGETMIVSRTGLVKSAQHRGVGFVLACLEWRKYPEKYPQWKTEPVLETLIVYGVSDEEEVTTTLDTTLARTEADSFFATGAVYRIFGDKAEKLTRREQADACKMLQATVDFLWERTGKSTRNFGEIGKVRQTHTATTKFLEDHPKLYKGVRHVWEENEGRQLSILRLQPGDCAAATYLMAARDSDLTRWDPTHGTEKDLNLSHWQQACDFITSLAAKEGAGKTTADAIALLLDDPEAPSRGVGKMVIMAKAFERIAAGKRVTAADLELEYADADSGKILINATGFGGIDKGPKVRKPVDDGEEPSREEVEAAARKERDNRSATPAKAPSEVSSSKLAFGPDGKPPPQKALPAKNGAQPEAAAATPAK